jgi:uncharacterized protein YcfJ
MKTTLTAALGAVTLLVASHAAAQVTFYSQEGMRGQPYMVNGTIVNFDGSGFNDRASSVIVERGRWEVCEHSHFRGRCSVLQPGQYPSLGAMGLNDRVSSVRRVSGNNPHYAYAPPPPVPEPYPYYPQHGERLYQADVVAVRVVVGPPEQRCWVEREQVVRDHGPNVPGAIIGGVLGGVIGHQFGSGRGNDVATAVGAIGGAAVGANVDRGGRRVYTQDVQRCSAIPGSGRPEYWDVTYVFRGQHHRAQLGFAPGSTITVNGRGEPRV